MRAFMEAEGKMINKIERIRLEEVFNHGASQIYEAREYWITSDSDHIDAAESWCYECAEKEIARLKAAHPGDEFILDGGWGSESDGQAFCESCGKILENSFTDYACEEEIAHFLKYGFDPMCSMDCFYMDKVIGARGWDTWDGFTGYARKNDIAYHHDLYHLCRTILDNHFWIMPDNDYRHMWM